MLRRYKMMLQQTTIAKAQMLIRKPIGEVFEAFVDPAITTKFWFTKSSGRLEPGKEVRWDWEMYGASVQVNVEAIENNQRILIEWSGNGTTTSVEWLFIARTDDTTLVRISNWGFEGSDDEKVEQAIDSKERRTVPLKTCGTNNAKKWMSENQGHGH
jgi:uncharacterized protein YndB with AHSA1/START domain